MRRDYPEPVSSAQTEVAPSLIDRHRPVDPRVHGVFVANAVAQIGIVVTGGLVRLTGSGLGCPTWPECVPGSLVPVAGQAEAFHKLVEFGNRTLTIVLVVLAIAALVALRGQEKRWRETGVPVRTPLRWLAAIPLIGTFAQALLGGVTVLTGLHPGTVGAHFLLSMAVIAGCVVLVHRSAEPGDRPVVVLVRPEVRAMGWALLSTGAVVLFLGTLVTGTGPHGGDADATERLPFDLRTVAWLHADMVLLFVGLLVGIWLALRITDGPSAARWWVRALLVLTVAQGAVGYLQWFSGVPWALVAVHMLMACLVWVATLKVTLSLRTRGVSDQGVPTPA